MDIFDSIPDGKKKYKYDILEMFEEAIRTSNPEKLTFCIAASSHDGIDCDYIDLYERIILADWHEEYEDIVDIVYQFKDDRFSNALNEISLNESKYRKYDTELESTLRKCIHALLAINSESSNEILEGLKKIKNSNIESIIEMYEK